MFTGIVEERGEVVDLRVSDTDQEAGAAGSARLTVRGPLVTQDAGHGDSIAVSGVCLTVVDRSADTFTVDVMAETLKRSTIGTLAPGDRVNLERSVTAATRLGGHIVQGHVDGTGVVLERAPSEHWEVVRVSLPTTLARYVVEKGSVTVDGVSLTVVEVGPDWFTVSLVPTTLAVTTLGRTPVGGGVNLEVDVIAKYVEKLFGASRPSAAQP
jgi:riboflavin synthase